MTIFGASIIFFIILGSLFIYNWMEYQAIREKFEDCDDSWCVYISGNVNYEMFVGISYMLNDSFSRVENREFQFFNSFGTRYNKTLSGVVLWDMLNQPNFLTDDANLIRFEASDGYKSIELPISIIRDFPEMVILVTHIDGQLIETKEDGGDGPLMAAVDFPSIMDNEEIIKIFEDHQQDFVYNSLYNVKYLDSIIVI